MGAFLYGIRLQFNMDIRSRSLLVTCYLVPLLFFAVMGGIFTSLMPGYEKTQMCIRDRLRTVCQPEVSHVDVPEDYEQAEELKDTQKRIAS